MWGKNQSVNRPSYTLALGEGEGGGNQGEALRGKERREGSWSAFLVMQEGNPDFTFRPHRKKNLLEGGRGLIHNSLQQHGKEKKLV